MTRLIDADAIHIIAIGGRMNGKDEFAKAIEEAIKKAPTIEAIPIEFIKERMDGYYKNSYTELGACLETLIEDWRKENETA